MDATSWVVIIAAIGTAAGSIVMSVVSMVLAHLRAVKNEDRLERMEAVNNKTHDLVNSASLEVRRSLAVALRQIAVLGPTEVTLLAAEAAEKSVAEHEEKQRRVDEEKKEVNDLRQTNDKGDQ